MSKMHNRIQYFTPPVGVFSLFMCNRLPFYKLILYVTTVRSQTVVFNICWTWRHNKLETFMALHNDNKLDFMYLTSAIAEKALKIEVRLRLSIDMESLNLLSLFSGVVRWRRLGDG